jgi:hypothetical protein
MEKLHGKRYGCSAGSCGCGGNADDRNGRHRKKLYVEGY